MGAPPPQSTSSPGRMISGPHPTRGLPERRMDPKDPRVRLRAPRIGRVPKPGRSAGFYLPKLDKVHGHSVTHSHLLLHMCREPSLVFCDKLEGVGWGNGGCSRGRGCVFNYGWFILSYGRNHYNIVKQFSSNNKKENIYYNNMGKKKKHFR